MPTEIKILGFNQPRVNAAGTAEPMLTNSSLTSPARHNCSKMRRAGSHCRHRQRPRLNSVQPTSRTADLEYAYTDAKFTDSAPEGNHIPGSIVQVVQTGISADFHGGWFGSLRLRYFGERPLMEDGSVTSDDSTVVNFRAGYRSSNWELKVDVLNVLDSDDHDIDYYYASRLPGEPAEGVEDIHYHILEPRTVRVYASYMF